MSENWLYLLPEGVAAADAQWPVWLRAADGSVSKARLDELAPTLSGPVIVVVPMEMLGCCEIGPVPGNRPRSETLAYAAEDQLATPLETVHLVFGLPDAQGHRHALVIEHQAMANLITLLQAQGIDPLRIHADTNLLGTGQPCALWLEGRWLLGGHSGPWLVARPQVAEVLAQQLPPMAWQAEAAHAGQALCNQSVDSALHVLVQGRATALDLRQGPYRRRGSALPWPSLAGGVLLALAMVCAADYLRVEWLSQRTAQLHAENVQAFLRWAPGQPVSSDLATQIRALEFRPRARTTVEALASFTEQLVETGNIRVEQATSSPLEGWRMEVIAQGFDDLERLRQRVPGVLMDQARQADQGVRATLTWRETR
ncbi:type II secretion system protein GspL [Pseudomonas sp. NPDC089996]|uniref:type II secretion system protein GspL n=1 Tax=Pseudomonas sp. NPDC089996 TaxID=3364474 RepID=UPI0037F21326